MNGGNRLSGRLGTYEAYDDFPADEDWPVDAVTGLVSMGFLKAAIRRSAMFCWIMTIAGFLLGCGIYVEFPAPHKASTSLLLTYGPYENGPGAQLDNQAIAETRSVAALAMHKLGLHGDPGGFLSNYTVTTVGDRILLITFSAPSDTQALSGASAVATAFLNFRADELQRAQALVLASLTQQVNQTKQKLSSLKAQIGQLSAQSASPTQQSQLNTLRSQFSNANTTLTNLEQTYNGTRSTDQPETEAAIKDSQVLDPAALAASSHLRTVLLYPGACFVGGIALAFGIVLIRAIVSDRLRRRDDVAGALGVPVRLSTGSLRPPKRWQLASRGSSATREAATRRISAYLAGVVPQQAHGAAALAVVAVDDPEAVAAPLVSLATSCAQRGQRVVLADLASGAPAARLLGVGEPGVGPVDVQHGRVIVAVPEHDDVAPTGPLTHGAGQGQRSAFTDAVATACAKGDILLTLVTLDPAFGGEHLATWATDAVAVVTAGESTWMKINASGEMVRLSGTRLVSAVLIGADKDDETLGVLPAAPGLDAEAALPGPNSGGDGSTLPAGPGRHPSMNGDGLR